MLNECVRVLKPGGYLVVQEMEWLVDFLDDQSAEEACPVMYQSVPLFTVMYTSSSLCLCLLLADCARYM